MRVMVLAGGPDRERPVSLMSGGAVAGALTEAGHAVRVCDIGPEDTGCLDAFEQWRGDVVFPVLHGSWGEGGPLQQALERRGLPFVGSRASAADRCMDKLATKRTLARYRLPTPPADLVQDGGHLCLEPPIVLKPVREGSSIDLAICHDQGQVAAARADLHRRHPTLMAERFIAGRELTVAVVDDADGPRALPVIEIIPVTAFYDYQAKYERNDTRYLFDIDLGVELLGAVQDMARAAHRHLGCRHLSRVDLIVDAQQRPWLLELNTMPGFTAHSLVPKAAARAGIPLPALVDRLVRRARADPGAAGGAVGHVDREKAAAET